MKARSLIYLFLLLFLTNIQSAKAQQLIECAPEALKKGQILIGDTVLQGLKPTRIRVKVIDTISHFSWPQEKVVLVYMMDGVPIATGMSGSPMKTSDGRIVGALAFRLGAFPLQAPLAAITPIRAMRNQLKVLGQQIPKSISQMTEQTEIFGLNNSQIAEINRVLGVERFKAQSNTQMLSQSNTSTGRQDLKAGESITGLLADGDFRSGFSCTVTEVADHRILTCGHQVFGLGPLQYYLYRSSIATTFRSNYSSFKLPNQIHERVGTATYDNIFAVEGTTKVIPDIMVPVSFKVSIDDAKYDYNFRVIQHPFISPILIKDGIEGLIGNLWSPTRVATARLTAKIYLKNRQEPREIYDSATISMRLMRFNNTEGYANPWEIFTNFQEKLTAIEQSEFKLQVSKVELKLDLWSGNRTLMFDSMAVMDSSGKPTEEIKVCSQYRVILGMRNEDATIKLARKFTLNIPCDLKLVKPVNEDTNYLDAQLYIFSGNKYIEMDPKKLPKAAPETAEEFLRLLSLNQKNPSEMFAVLVLPEEETTEKQNKASGSDITSDSWTAVPNLEFLRERSQASEPRVIVLPLGTPLQNGIVNFQGSRQLKLMLK